MAYNTNAPNNVKGNVNLLFSKSPGIFPTDIELLKNLNPKMYYTPLSSPVPNCEINALYDIIEMFSLNNTANVNKPYISAQLNNQITRDINTGDLLKVTHFIPTEMGFKKQFLIIYICKREHFPFIKQKEISEMFDRVFMYRRPHDSHLFINLGYNPNFQQF